jgi:hypothetical protein
MIPGKLDCTRSRPHPRSPVAYIHLLGTILTLLCSGALGQSPPPYPEIGWLARSSYCNPYFGFRLALPAEFKSEPIFLPVQSHGRHVLLAMHLQRLDRSADILISGFEDRSENPARFAAKARALQARERGLTTSGPGSISVQEHEFYRLNVVNDVHGMGTESSYFFVLRGYLLQIAIFSHEPDLVAALDSAVEHHLEFLEPGESSCTNSAPVSASSPHPVAEHPVAEPARLYYGPALPTDLVESTLRDAPGDSIPSGRFSQATFADPALGIRVELPPGWQALPNEEAYQITELMRDPTTDPGITDRRRALFHACTRVLFTAADPRTEPISQVHPSLAVAAMPQGCIPDMMLPVSSGDHDAAENLAVVLVRSLGVLMLGRGSMLSNSEGRAVTFNLDGALPYHLPGDMLSRRLGLRVSATANGPWLIFVYSVTPTLAAQRDLESRITIGSPDASPAK